MRKLIDYIKIKLEEDKKGTLITMAAIAIIFLLVVGATLAFFIAQGGNAAQGNVNVLTHTNDFLSFAISKDLYIDVNSETLAKGKGNIRDSATATALLKANSSTNYAKYDYYIYLKINTNTLGYTTPEQTPELLLKVKNPDGVYLEEIAGLEYVTVGAESGFDVTVTSGVIKLAEAVIETNGTISREWEIELVFVNLETDQIDNTGKEFDAKILLQKEENVIPEVYVATTYNGNAAVPSTVGAAVTFTCNGNTATYNNKYNRLEISQMSEEYSVCSLQFNDRTNKDYLNSKIIALSGNGSVVQENGYRYEGKTPNNYIWFNNQMWRIIGVFGQDSHGVANTNLVKIIKADTIGGYAWDKNNRNNWATASLYNLLNTYYYNATDGTGSGYCYMHQSSLTRECNFGDVGIHSEYRSMIKNVTWYLGGYTSPETLDDGSTSTTYYGAELSKIYELERSNNVPSGNPTSTKGYIGLMYGSDYGYSVPSTCTTRDFAHMHNNDCAGKSWIYGQGYEWLLTPLYDTTTDVVRINYSGYASPNNANLGREVRPVLYLNENVYVISGTGTITDPYIIGM